MNLSLRRISLVNKIVISLGFAMLIFPEKSALANEAVPAEMALIAYNDVQMPDTTGFKSYMSYTTLRESSTQGILQSACTTDEDGFRKFNGRYVIAVGTGVGGTIGSYVDVILENGVVIPCVIGDYKQDCHTDESNLVGLNGCASELIVDINQLVTPVRRSGDASNYQESWNSKVVMIRVYQ